jgi:HTH-type transcriptional regulator/antitoxin HigA
MNTLLDESNYGKLLKKTLPLVIHTDAEHQRLLLAASDLMDKPETEMSEEEGRMLEMLSMLIEEYEDRVHPLPETEPHKMLNHLLQEKGLRPADLADILPKSRVSEILNGKLGISKTQAKQLAARLRVPVELFL